MASRRSRAALSVLPGKIAALSLLFVLAVPGCAPTPASTPSPGSSTATPSPTASSAPPSSIPAASASFDPALAAKLQADLEDLVSKLHYPALTAAVILPDGSSWSGAAGMADVGAGTPATPETSFAVASVTKTFIAALALELAHDGVLSLDDPVAKWLPQLAGDARFAADRVTIRELLDHTSGIAEYADSEAFLADVLKDPARRWTPAELLSYVGDPTFAPGTDWAYTNTNYLLAGMVIERVSGTTAASLLRRRSWTRSGSGEPSSSRRSSQPARPPTATPSHSQAQRPTSRSTCGTAAGSRRTHRSPAPPVRGAGSPPLRPTSPAGPPPSTAARCSIRPRSPRCSTSSGTPTFPMAARMGWGRGRGSDGGPTIGHSGGMPGFQSGMWHLSKQRATLVILTDTDAVLLDPAYHSLQRIVLEHLGA